jgi:hypothetical protein
MTWWKRDATLSELADIVLPLLQGIPSPGIATTDLMRRMGSTKAHMTGLAKALKTLRVAHPKLTCEFPGEGTFNSTRVLWHDPTL